MKETLLFSAPDCSKLNYWGLCISTKERKKSLRCALECTMKSLSLCLFQTPTQMDTAWNKRHQNSVETLSIVFIARLFWWLMTLALVVNVNEMIFLIHRVSGSLSWYVYCTCSYHGENMTNRSALIRSVNNEEVQQNYQDRKSRYQGLSSQVCTTVLRHQSEINTSNLLTTFLTFSAHYLTISSTKDECFICFLGI